MQINLPKRCKCANLVKVVAITLLFQTGWTCKMNHSWTWCNESCWTPMSRNEIAMTGTTWKVLGNRTVDGKCSNSLGIRKTYIDLVRPVAPGLRAWCDSQNSITLKKMADPESHFTSHWPLQCCMPCNSATYNGYVTAPLAPTVVELGNNKRATLIWFSPIVTSVTMQLLTLG